MKNRRAERKRETGKGGTKRTFERGQICDHLVVVDIIAQHLLSFSCTILVELPLTDADVIESAEGVVRCEVSSACVCSVFCTGLGEEEKVAGEEVSEDVRSEG
jgi:hypothetical protein